MRGGERGRGRGRGGEGEGQDIHEQDMGHIDSSAKKPGKPIEEVIADLHGSRFPYREGDRVLHAKRSTAFQMSMQDLATVFLVNFHGISKSAFEALRGI